MADEFIDVGIDTDEQTLADGAIDRLMDSFVGYEPNEGDLEVVMVEVLAPMVADAASTAALVPSAVFRTVLQELHGVDYQEGVPATTTAVFTMTDTDREYVIPEGTEVDVDGYAFTVDNDVIVTTLTVTGVALTAADPGADFNNLTGETVLLISSLAFVASVDTEAVTAGGLDAEDDRAFQDRGSLELELQAKTLVTARDYELMALSRPAVDRAVVVIDTVNRTITVTASPASGAPLPQTEKDDLADIYAELRQTTWVVTLGDATITTISVTYTVHPYPGYIVSDLIGRINDSLTNYLSPASWGQPIQHSEGNRWLLEPRVRKNKLIDLISDVDGVDYVGDVTITGSAGSAQGNGDWLMPGTVPLANVGTLAASIV